MARTSLPSDRAFAVFLASLRPSLALESERYSPLSAEELAWLDHAETDAELTEEPVLTVVEHTIHMQQVGAAVLDRMRENRYG